MLSGRADVALVPQASALVKPLSVFHNVYMGRLDRHSTAYNLRTLVWPAACKVAEVRSVLASVGLDGEIFSAAGALSGGQQQRTSVARALYNGRPILIGDEPVSALDRVQGADVLSLLRSRHQTLVLALHDVHHRARARRSHRRAGARAQGHRRAVEQAHGQRPPAAFRRRAVNRLAFGNTSLLFLISRAAVPGGRRHRHHRAEPMGGNAPPGARDIASGRALPIEAWSVVWTVAFAVVGVGIGADRWLPARDRLSPVRRCARLSLGAALDPRAVLGAASDPGLRPAARPPGCLAIAIPYAGIFAKVFAEMIEEADLAAERVLPNGTSAISAFAFARLPEVAERFKTYTLYRLECGLRSTLVLGFVGLPTVGFHLEGYFKQGKYAEAAALLGVFYVLIGTRRLWARPATVPILVHRQPAAAARGDWRWLGACQPRPLRHARHRAFPVAQRRRRQSRNLERLRILAAAHRLEPDRAWSLEHHRAGADCPRRHGNSGAAAVSLGLAISSWGASDSLPAACCWSWSAPRPNTCWPTCCCSCWGRPCCRRSLRSRCTTAPSSAI